MSVLSFTIGDSTLRGFVLNPGPSRDLYTPRVLSYIYLRVGGIHTSKNSIVSSIVCQIILYKMDGTQRSNFSEGFKNQRIRPLGWRWNFLRKYQCCVTSYSHFDGHSGRLQWVLSCFSSSLPQEEQAPLLQNNTVLDGVRRIDPSSTHIKQKIQWIFEGSDSRRTRGVVTERDWSCHPVGV